MNTVSEIIADATSEMHHNSVVTGLIKGTGIANLYMKEDGSYCCKNARNFYIKSIRIFKAYNVHKNISRIIAQMYCAKKVSANKLLKIKNNSAFENFVKELETEGEISSNQYGSNKLLDEIDYFISPEIMNEIIESVLLFIRNPSLRIKTQTTNPLLKKLRD